MKPITWVPVPGVSDSSFSHSACVRLAAGSLMLFVICAGSSASARAQERVEGQQGKREVAQPHFVVSLLELSRRPQLPDAEEFESEPNQTTMPPARPLPPNAETGAPWPPMGRPAPTPTISLTAATQADVNSSPLPAQLFGGGIDNNKATPPDTGGAVGPNHVVVMLNTGVSVASRLGVQILHVSLPTFWAAANSSSTNPFDPKIMFDPNAGRWIASAAAGENSTASSILVAMSVTDDPTGSWVMFIARADPAGALAADAPLLGFNKDWVVVSANMAPISSGSTNATISYVKIFVFNKSDLATGSAIRFTTFTDSASFALMPATTYDPTLSTLYLVQDWNGNSGGIGTLRISTITGAVGSETYKLTNTFPSSSNTWQTCKLQCALGDFATQLGSTQKIQNNDSRVQSVTYQNGSLWVSQNAFIPAQSPDHTVAQWWQITQAGVEQFGRIDGGPGTFYAFPTNVANANGDMLIGFSSFSSTKYATAAYAFRSVTDPAGTVRNIVEYKPGENFYYKINLARDNRNRWGDYSSTVIDPRNGIDMWTLQEYASSPDFVVSGVDYSRWGTYWAKVSPNLNTALPQTGWWWDSALGGIGFFVESGGTSANGMFMAGFLYDPAGNATWLVSTGQMAGSVYAGNWLKVTGGQTLTGAYQAPAGNSSAGALTVAFQDATHAVMTRPDGSQINLTRFSFSTSTPAPPVPGSSQVGWWWADPAGAGYGTAYGGGTGYGVEIQGSNVFVVAYVYDTGGNPVWYLATGSLTTPTTYTGTWDVYAGGPQLTSVEGSAPGAHLASGSSVPMSLTFTDATHGTLTMGGVTIPIIRFQLF